MTIIFYTFFLFKIHLLHGKKNLVVTLIFSQELGKDVTRLPYSIRVLLENQLRNIDGYKVKEEDMNMALRICKSEYILDNLYTDTDTITLKL